MWHVNRESFVHHILVTPFLSFWIMSQYILLAKATNYWQTKSYYNQGGIKIQRWGTQMYFLCTVPGIRSIPRSSCSTNQNLCVCSAFPPPLTQAAKPYPHLTSPELTHLGERSPVFASHRAALREQEGCMQPGVLRVMGALRSAVGNGF